MRTVKEGKIASDLNYEQGYEVVWGIGDVISAYLTSTLDAEMWSFTPSVLCLEYGPRVLVYLKGSVRFLAGLEAFLVSDLEPRFTGCLGGGLVTVVNDLPRHLS